jgi:hypothetical protein
MAGVSINLSNVQKTLCGRRNTLVRRVCVGILESHGKTNIPGIDAVSQGRADAALEKNVFQING